MYVNSDMFLCCFCLHQFYTGGGPPTPQKNSFEKAEPHSQFCGKYIHKHLKRIRVSLI
jgi:hypothetical protein